MPYQATLRICSSGWPIRIISRCIVRPRPSLAKLRGCDQYPMEVRALRPCQGSSAPTMVNACDSEPPDRRRKLKAAETALPHQSATLLISECTCSTKARRASQPLPHPRRLRANRTATPALARTAQAANRLACHAQRQDRHAHLERAHPHHRSPDRTLPRPNSRLPHCRLGHHDLRQSARNPRSARRRAEAKKSTTGSNTASAPDLLRHASRNRPKRQPRRRTLLCRRGSQSQRSRRRPIQPCPRPRDHDTRSS